MGLGGVGGDVILGKLLLLFVGVIEVLFPGGDGDEEEVIPGDVVIVPSKQEVVGFVAAQAQREFAADRTEPTEAPQLFITQF